MLSFIWYSDSGLPALFSSSAPIYLVGIMSAQSLMSGQNLRAKMMRIAWHVADERTVSFGVRRRRLVTDLHLVLARRPMFYMCYLAHKFTRTVG